MNTLNNSTVNTEKTSLHLEKIAFHDRQSGILYVSRTHVYDPSVRNFQHVLRVSGYTPRVEQVDMDVVQSKRLLSDDTKVEAIDRSEMQRSATELFGKAVLSKASDIHIRVSFKGHTKILFRVHGDLEFHSEHTSAWGKLLCSAIYTAMSDISDSTYKELARQDARISSVDKLPLGLDGIRIATTPQVDGIVMVLRLLYNDTEKTTDICDLGFSVEQSEMISQMRRKPVGINIISGPTGSGKSTTLKNTLMSIHKDSNGKKNIITVEDPPEYPMTGVVQTPVANANSIEERSIAFQEAIRATLRCDPNVIMIGEIRDTPSARLAVQAAMTGHQVWTTVHANGAFAIILRMIDLGLSISIMSDADIITGLVCQRLLKTLCTTCKVPFLIGKNKCNQDSVERIEPFINEDTAFVMGLGCPDCNQKGVSGRTVVAEVVVPDAKMMFFISQGNKEQAIKYWREKGGKTMIEMAIEKINNGLCDPFDAEEEVGLFSSGSNFSSAKD
jgi:type II secretory ATPase GspE/PulE/Tfp pilus assembly ATPase PilB-like protein